MKKQQLEVEPDLDFLLLGLVSSHKASKVAFLINQMAHLNLERVIDFILPDYNPKVHTSFSKFTWFDEENHLDYSLLANKEFGICLFNQLKNFDYLLIIRGGIEFFDSKNFIAQCMKINGVTIAALIDNEKIKAKLGWMV